MRHQVREEAAGIIVALEGDVDLESSPSARSILLQAVSKGQPVFVDLSRVSYIDSSGLASLIEALQQARKNEMPFALAEVSEAALRVLKLARLDRVFVIHPTLEDALSGAS